MTTNNFKCCVYISNRCNFLNNKVIAARNQDKLCLAIAEELEKAFGGWIPPPFINTN